MKIISLFCGLFAITNGMIKRSLIESMNNPGQQTDASTPKHPKLKYNYIYLRALENALSPSLVKIRREINEILEEVSCVGFLISADLVYTAAHCLIHPDLVSSADAIDRQIEQLRVQTFLGANLGPPGFMFRVRFLFIHTSFEEKEKGTYNADFGIIKLHIENHCRPIGPFLEVNLKSKIRERDWLVVLKWGPDFNSFALENADEVCPVEDCITTGSDLTEGDKICIKNAAQSEIQIVAGSPIMNRKQIVGIQSFTTKTSSSNSEKEYLFATALHSYKESINNVTSFITNNKDISRTSLSARQFNWRFGSEVA